DEDRPAGVPPDGRGLRRQGSRLCQLRLPDRRAPHQAGHGRECTPIGEGAPAIAASQGLRYLGTDPIFLRAARSNGKWGLSLFLPLLFLLLAGCAQTQPLPPGAVTFALMGDTPYGEGEARRLDLLIDDLNAAELAFVVHVG